MLRGKRPGGACPLWVIRVGLTGPRRLPVYPGKRTFSGKERMSQRCQRRTFACSLNYLIGTRDERERYGKPQLLGSLEVDGQLEFRDLVERDVAGLCSPENCV